MVNNLFLLSLRFCLFMLYDVGIHFVFISMDNLCVIDVVVIGEQMLLLGCGHGSDITKHI